MEQSLHWSRSELWIRKLVYPGHTLPTAAAPALVAAGLAAHDGVLRAWQLGAALLAGWLIQLGGVLADNRVNLRSEPDDREHPELVQALRDGRLSLRSLDRALWACFLAAILLGAYLVHEAGLGVFAIGAASIAASLAYSAGPAPIGRLGLADPLFFLFFGLVSVAGMYYVQAAPAHGAVLSSWIVADALPACAVALGIPVGALTTNILIIDDIRDRSYDAVKGKRTVAVRFGSGWSRAEFAALLLVAYVALFWLWIGLGFGPWVLLPLLSLPYAVSTARDVFAFDRHEDLVPVTPKAGRLLLGFSLLLGIGVALPAMRA